MTNTKIFAALAAGVAAISAFVFTWTEPPAEPWPNRSFAVDCAKPSPPVPEGGIPVNELCNIVLDVPDWRTNTTCPTTSVAFSDGRTTTYGAVNETIDRAAYLDIEKDGRAETAILLSCGGKGWRRQVLVVERNRAGLIVTREQIVATAYPVADIFDLIGTQTGQLTVQVGDYPSAPATASRQWFTYRSNGSQLVQTDGQLAANPKVSDLFVSTTDITFRSPAEGVRSGTLTATVRNFGSSTVPFSLRMTLPTYAEVVSAPPNCAAAVPSPEGNHVVCELEGVATNGATQVALTLRAPANADQLPVQTPPVLAAVLTVKDGYADLGISPKSVSYHLRLE